MLGLLSATRISQARHHRAAEPPAGVPTAPPGARHAESPAEGAQRALAAGDIAGAYQILDQAYRVSPQAGLLFWLGRVAAAEKHPTAAQDYMRRFLTETGADSDAAMVARRAEAQKVAELLPDPSAEVRLVGPKGALLLVDERLAGSLPLPGPLLLAAGPHRVAIETRRKSLGGKVEITAGRGVEVLFDVAASAVLVSQQPVVLVLRFDRGVLLADQVKLGVAIREAFSKAHCSPAQAADALRSAPDFHGCLAELGCQLRLADKNGMDYALRLTIDSKPAAAKEHRDLQVSAAVLDVAVGAVAAQSERTCADCTLDKSAEAVTEAVAEVLGQGLGRPRGALTIETAPVGATVTIDGQRVGVAPVRRDVLAGEHTVELSAIDQKPAAQRVRVEPGQTKTLQVLMAAEPPEVEPSPGAPLVNRPGRFFYPRPFWRLLAGGVAVGAGLILTGFGSSALTVNGQCATAVVPPMTTCPYLLTTAGIGGGLLGTGLALTLGGAALITVPGPPPVLLLGF